MGDCEERVQGFRSPGSLPAGLGLAGLCSCLEAAAPDGKPILVTDAATALSKFQQLFLSLFSQD